MPAVTRAACALSGVLLIAVVSGCRLTGQAGSSAPASLLPTATASTTGLPQITTQDELDFDLTVEAPPSTAPTPMVNAVEAEAIARAELVADGSLLMVRHGYGTLEVSSPRQTIWIVVIEGGPDVPCGPSPAPDEAPLRCRAVYEGVKIDDQTGAVLRHFSSSEQYVMTPAP